MTFLLPPGIKRFNGQDWNFVISSETVVSSYVAVYLKLLVLFASEFVYETMTSLLVGLFLTSRYCICNSSKNALKGFLMFSGGSKGNIGKKRIKTKLNSTSILL